METEYDLRELLQEWPFDAEHTIRLATMPDGRRVMQIRLPLGIEQYELEGRPDGVRPYGMVSALDYQQQRLERFRRQDAGAQTFRLDPSACQELFQEGLLYYYRYLHLFELEEWDASARDTARNLELFDFVKRYAQRDEDRIYLEQWRPYVIRFDAVARAMLEITGRRSVSAAAILAEAAETIEDLPDLDHPTFQYERDRSLHALRELINQIQTKKEPSAVERLEAALRQAVDAEEFERAAQLRDRLRLLQANQEDSSCA